MTPPPKIKICGLKTPAHVQLLGELQVDYAGFVFVHQSPRHVTFTQAQPLIQAARHARVKTVGLFCNAPRSAVRLAAEALGLDAVQLHGQEDADYLRTLALPGDTQLWKAIAFTPDAADAYRGSASIRPDRFRPPVDALLLDAPPSDGLTGGTGHAFDWTALAQLDRTGLPPLILAGGLTPANVADAIAQTHPHAVDVSSGVESTRGIKSPDLIRAFVKSVRGDRQPKTC